MKHELQPVIGPVEVVPRVEPKLSRSKIWREQLLRFTEPGQSFTVTLPADVRTPSNGIMLRDALDVAGDLRSCARHRVRIACEIEGRRSMRIRLAAWKNENVRLSVFSGLVV